MRNHMTLLMFVLPTVVGGTTFAADKDSGSSATLYGSISQGVVIGQWVAGIFQYLYDP